MSASANEQKLRRRKQRAESMQRARQHRKQHTDAVYQSPSYNPSHTCDESGDEDATTPLTLTDPSCGSSSESIPLKPKRTIWKVEFEPSSTTTRLHIYEMLAPICEKLVVTFEQNNHLTTGSELAITASRCAVAVCLLVDATADEPTAHHQIAAALSDIVINFNLVAVHNWCTLVAHVTGEDVEAEVKHIPWSELHLRYKLWWLIIAEKVRSSRSTNTRLISLLSGSSSAKAILNNLLTEYRVQTNLNNPQRIDYKLCLSVTDADNQIVTKQPWAEEVLDWFAERLPQPEQNRRSLYLWGDAGVGKSRLIARLLAGRMCLRRDCCEGFFLQDLVEEYEFVWLDEFVPETVTSHGEYRQQFNKLTGREQVLVRVKYGTQYEVDASNIRTIICSNEPPPTQDYFARRLHVVIALSCLYENDMGAEESKKKKKIKGAKRRRSREPITNHYNHNDGYAYGNIDDDD
jgi:ribosome assembly protein YihI (activator of Der GTPase)